MSPETRPEATIPEIQPVRVEVQVARTPADAFRIFTEEIHTWWPLVTHSIGQGQAVSCTVGGRVGGRIFERLEDGSEHEWGRILTWEPPTMVRFTWHPGRPAETSQEVEVRFHELGAEETRVELIHSGWERYGEGAAESRDEYQPGWRHVLVECFGAAVGRG